MRAERFKRGLEAMAAVGLRSPHKWGDAHPGAAAIAGELLLRDSALDATCRREIGARLEEFERELERFFVSLPSEPRVSAVDAEAAVIAAFARKAGRLCAIGHNVIFSVMAIQALRAGAADVSRSMVEGLVALIDAFGGNPGYFWGDGKARVLRIEPKSENLPPYERRAFAGAVLEAFATLDRTYDEEVRDMQLGHVLTHGHAVLELDRLGYASLAEAASRAFHHRLGLFSEMRTRFGPPAESQLAPDAPAVVDVAFWRRDFRRSTWWDHGHVFKYAHSYFELLRECGRSADDEETKRYRWLEHH